MLSSELDWVRIWTQARIQQSSLGKCAKNTPTASPLFAPLRVTNAAFSSLDGPSCRISVRSRGLCAPQKIDPGAAAIRDMSRRTVSPTSVAVVD